MSELAAETQSTSINPMEDLEGWTAQRASELTANAKAGEAEAQPSEPAAEPPAPVEAATPTPEEKKASWRDAVLDDIDDEFLKGKPAAELLKSQKAAVAAMQKAQREANEARGELQRLRGEAEARKEPPPVSTTPAPDPQGDEIDRLLFENTPEGRKLLEERLLEKSRAVAREEYATASQAETERQWKQNAANASITATQRVAQMYGWDENEAILRMKTAFPLINDYVPQYGPQLWLNENVYVQAIERLYGAPPAPTQAVAEEPVAEPVAKPKAPAAPNPPGSQRPAPVAAMPTKAASLLTREQQDARRILAEQVIARVPDVKFDVDEFARGKQGRKNA